MHGIVSLRERESDATEPCLQRARGQARVAFRRGEDRTTRVADLFQEGCLKLRLPRPEREGEADLVIINTAGGLTGGDRLSIRASVGDGAHATVTTPACEHVYRSIDGAAFIEQRLQVGGGARLDWIPQGTILFDRSRMRRRLVIQLEADAEITVAEAILFGRTEMGETVNSGSFSDVWTVRRGGSLLYADAMRIAEPFRRTTACSTTLAGHAAMASVIHVGRDLAAKRDALRVSFAQAGGVIAGASVIGDVLVVRIVAPGSSVLRRLLIAALGSLRDRRTLPRNWLC